LFLFRAKSVSHSQTELPVEQVYSRVRSKSNWLA